MVKRTPLRHLKRNVLHVLAKGPRTADEIARDARFWPIRAVYPYMRRLEYQGLVRGSVRFRKVEYAITGKGRARLRWFEAHPHYFERRYLRAARF